jgi:hypothetical protein
VFLFCRIRYLPTNTFDRTHTKNVNAIIRQKSVVAHVGKARPNRSCLMSRAAETIFQPHSSPSQFTDQPESSTHHITNRSHPNTLRSHGKLPTPTAATHLTHLTGTEDKLHPSEAGSSPHLHPKVPRMPHHQRPREAPAVRRADQRHASERYIQTSITSHRIAHKPSIATKHARPLTYTYQPRLRPSPPRRKPHPRREDRLRQLVLVLHLRRQARPAKVSRKRSDRLRKSPRHRQRAKSKDRRRRSPAQGRRGDAG